MGQFLFVGAEVVLFIAFFVREEVLVRLGERLVSLLTLRCLDYASCRLLGGLVTVLIFDRKPRLLATEFIAFKQEEVLFILLGLELVQNINRQTYFLMNIFLLMGLLNNITSRQLLFSSLELVINDKPKSLPLQSV